jgi:hypothetical protein
MSWEKLANNRIDEAIAAGEFDNLPGLGKPLDLAEYFSQPAAERVGVHLLKNAEVMPPEVELLRQIAALEEALTACAASEMDAARRDRMKAELQEKRVAFALAMERRRRRGAEE